MRWCEAAKGGRLTAEGAFGAKRLRQAARLAHGEGPVQDDV